MAERKNEALEALRKRIIDLVENDPVMLDATPAGFQASAYLIIEFNQIPIDRETRQHIEREALVKLKKSSEPFTEEHFEALLELPLIYVDRRFIEAFQGKWRNKATPDEWMKAGFGQQPNQARINKLCLDNGLRIRFLQREKIKGVSWFQSYHSFFVMEPSVDP